MGRKVLVADDQSTHRRLMVDILETDGHEVVQVEDGAQAWEALSEGGFEIALLDWTTPRMDGLELSERYASELPTATCTSYS